MPFAQIWDAFKRAMHDAQPQQEIVWRPGANREQLEYLETLVAAPLPDDVREYFRLCGGNESERTQAFLPWYLEEWPQVINYLEVNHSIRERESPAALKREAAKLKVSRGSIKAEPWSTKHIPFVGNARGGFHVIDLDPAKGGTHGQIISVFHDEHTFTLLAPSISDYFALLTSEFDTGNLYWHEDPIYPQQSRFVWKERTRAEKLFVW